MKSSMQRGRWGAGTGPLGKCPICVAEHECVVPSGHCSQPAAGGAPTTPQVLVLPLLTQASLSLLLISIPAAQASQPCGRTPSFSPPPDLACKHFLIPDFLQNKVQVLS